jgi:Protein of unknown function (DUF2786)
MTETTTPDQDKLLDRVRKLLAKAEAEGVTPPEAEALTAKASELMARYGIDRALLAATGKLEDKPGDHLFDIDGAWKRIKAHLLCALATAMRCSPVILAGERSSTKVHVYGYESDLGRLDALYTSLLVQMSHALAVNTDMPDYVRGRSMAAWSRSWLLGWVAGAVARVRAAEAAAVAASQSEHHAAPGTGTELVLADRSLVVHAAFAAAYPVIVTSRATYSGTGYGAGYRKGQQADLGGGRIRNGQRSLR